MVEKLEAIKENVEDLIDEVQVKHVKEPNLVAETLLLKEHEKLEVIKANVVDLMDQDQELVQVKNLEVDLIV